MQWFDDSWNKKIYREGRRGGSAVPLLHCTAAVRRPSGRAAWAIDFRWRLAAVGAVGAPIIVEDIVGSQVPFGFDQIGVGAQVNLLVFDRAPEAFDENVAQAPAFAVHGDFHSVRLEHAGELRAGELAALIGVEDLRKAVSCERTFAQSHADRRIQRIGKFPCSTQRRCQSITAHGYA